MCYYGKFWITLQKNNKRKEIDGRGLSFSFVRSNQKKKATLIFSSCADHLKNGRHPYSRLDHWRVYAFSSHREQEKRV